MKSMKFSYGVQFIRPKYIIRWYESGTEHISAIDLTTNTNLQDVSDLNVGSCNILYYNDTEIT